MDDRTWVLYVTDGSEQERAVPLQPGRVLTIGRAESSGLRLKAASVSRTHALLEWHLGRPFLSDRGSTHGTRIGGEAVTTPRELRSGDTIYLADASLRVVALETSDPRTTTLPAIAGPESPGVTETPHGTKASPSARGGTHGSSTVTPWHQRSKAAILGAGALAAAILGVVNLWAVIFPADPADVAEIESIHVIRQLTLADFAAEGPAGNLSIRPAALGKEEGTSTGTGVLVRPLGESPLPTLQTPAQPTGLPAAPSSATSGTVPHATTTNPYRLPVEDTPSLGQTHPPGLAPPQTPETTSATSASPSASGSLTRSFIFRAEVAVPEAISNATCEHDELENLEKDACVAALAFTLKTVDEDGAFVPPPEAATELASALSEVEMDEGEQGSDPRGWTLAVRLDLEGLANRQMLVSWSLDGRDIPVAWRSENLACKVTASTAHDAGTAQVWIPNLERPGPYNVNIRLSFASDGTIADAKQLLITND